MKPNKRMDKAYLLATGKSVAARLKLQSIGTRLRVRMPSRVGLTNTDGWLVSLGDLGRSQPRLEIWLDRFTGYPERKFFVCLRSSVRRQITAITKRVARQLWPVRVIQSADANNGKHFILLKRLRRSEFNLPVLEKYSEGATFFGLYDPNRETAERTNPHFCERAAAFFEDVARALPRAIEDEQREVYPQCENRKRVASHLQRERSRLLATECKIRDNYECQVCGMRFEELYGSLGKAYAEAHHAVPLSQLRSGVRTRLEDLRTVCANCHRMLHRMEGKREDLRRLGMIIRNARRKGTSRKPTL